MESGRFDRHLRRVRDVYRSRRDVLAAEVATAFPDSCEPCSEPGCHFLLRLPEGLSDEDVVETSRAM